jgi:glycosidase
MRDEKLFIYQLLPRLFGNQNSANKRNGTIEENGCGTFNDITMSLLKKLRESGYTHVWYIGVLAHASTTDYTAHGIPKQSPEIVKGKAGSPYAVRDYYDVDPDLAEDVPNRMIEFEELVARTHAAGLKVIIDNVPNHVAREYRSIKRPDGVKDFGEGDDSTVAFAPNNNFYYLPGQELEISFRDTNYREFPAKATGNDCFTNRPSINDWYETVKLNYGVDWLGNRTAHFEPVPDTWLKMKDIFMFWAEKKVDGFRCDMAEMVPLAFWRWLIPRVKKRFPGTLFIAEIYNQAAYRDFLATEGFDYLYDKVGLYDTVRDVACGHRPASDISLALHRVGDIQHRMLNFLENHDEQRVASDFFLGDGQKARAAMLVTACVNNNPVMIYAGQELGERGMDEEGFSGRDGRTSIFDYWSMDTLRRWNNGGRWNDALLTPEEIRLKDFYSRIICLCNQEEALASGLFYDLMPPNYPNKAYDSTSVFSFLRGNDTRLLLIAVNFSDREQSVSIHIPPHAYRFFNREQCLEKGVRLTSLLEENGEMMAFRTTDPVNVTLPANDGEIFEISFT